MTDAPTEPLFVALASVLAAIENGTIAEGEVESRVDQEQDGVTTAVTVTVTVRKAVRPLIGPADSADA